MADFMTNLWSAIFEAGPTPTLLLATNATFAALQVVLLALLLATYSIHFVILSFLCAGLWYAINWFAAELRAAQQQEETADSTHKSEEHDNVSGRGGEKVSTTSEAGRHNQSEIPDLAAALPQPAHAADMADKGVSQPAKVTGGSVSSAFDASETRIHNIRQRSTQETVDSCGEPSTDSDWEQIDGER